MSLDIGLDTLATFDELPIARVDTTPRIPVNHIYADLQKLGRYSGFPSIFIQLQGCDVRCSWCNVPETWQLINEPLPDWRRKYARWNEFTVVEIANQCLKFKQRHVVITGGEPLMHDIDQLVVMLLKLGFTVQIETSGTKSVKGIDRGAWLTVSPKFAGKINLDTLNRADEIIFPVAKSDSLRLLRTQIVPYIRKMIPVYLHVVISKFFSQVNAAAFQYNYYVVPPSRKG